MTITSTTAAPDMAAISTRYLAAWEARDPDRIVALHREDTRFVSHVGSAPARGRAAVREAFAAIFALFPDFAFETHRVVHGPRHWLLDWTLLSAGVRLHCFDLVEVAEDGLVANKETWVAADQYEAVIAHLAGGTAA